MGLLTIVVEFEGDTPPLTCFGVPVLGCEVVAIGIGNYIAEALESAEKLQNIEFGGDE